MPLEQLTEALLEGKRDAVGLVLVLRRQVQGQVGQHDLKVPAANHAGHGMPVEGVADGLATAGGG